MYHMYSIQSDIIFAVGQLSKYNINLKKVDLQMVKRVVRYLKSTMDISLIFDQKIANYFLRKSPPYNLVDYVDSDFVENLEDQKSVMGYYFFLNRAIVLQSSKKQRTVSTLTTKREYIILGHTAKENMQIKRFINKMRLEKTVKSFMLYENNKMSITLTKNVESQHCTKYINV